MRIIVFRCKIFCFYLVAEVNLYEAVWLNNEEGLHFQLYIYPTCHMPILNIDWDLLHIDLSLFEFG